MHPEYMGFWAIFSVLKTVFDGDTRLSAICIIRDNQKEIWQSKL